MTGAAGLGARAGRPGVAWVRARRTVLFGAVRVGAWGVGGWHRVPGRYRPIHGRAVPLVRPVRVGLRPGVWLDDRPLALVRAGPVGRRALPTLVGARPCRGGGLRVSRTVSLRDVAVGLRGPPVLRHPAPGVRIRGSLAARRAVVPPATRRFSPVRGGTRAGLPPAVTAGFTPFVATRPAPAGFPPARLAPAGRAPLRLWHRIVAPVEAGTTPTTVGIVR